MYHIVKYTLCLFSLLPLWLHYAMAYLLYLLLYYLLRYRRRVVRTNLQNSFPEKSRGERLAIERGFYRSLCDYFVETIKLATISRRAIMRRMRFEGLEQIDAATAGGRSSVLYLAHTFNWEWITTLPLNVKEKARMGQVYHPLENKMWNRLFLELRGRFGGDNIPMARTLKHVIECNRKKQNFVVGFLSDQVPSWEAIGHWVDFMNQETPVLTGTEKIAGRLHCAAFYGEMVRERRGHYVCRITKLCDDAAELQENELTDRYFALLQKSIYSQPTQWLWTHRRWKRTRQRSIEREERRARDRQKLVEQEEEKKRAAADEREDEGKAGPIKVLLHRHDDWFFAQTPGSGHTSADGRYRFFSDADMVGDPDVVVVRNKKLAEGTRFNVAPQNLVLVTSEPRSVLHLSRPYCRQFGMVCSSQELSHPRRFACMPLLPWFVGVNYGAAALTVNWGYSQFKQMPLPPKERLISVITSNKAFTRGHRERIRFVQQLKEHFGDRLQIFGRGFRPFDDKWEVLAPYKYHIVIENSVAPHYVTEKLKDAFLAESLPFYYGAPNAGDYFPAHSFVPIDIHRPKECIRTIEEAIAGDLYSSCLPALRRAKELVRDDYNMFEVLARFCDRLDVSLPRRRVTLHSEKHYGGWVNAYNHLVKWNVQKFIYKVGAIFGKEKLG